MNGYFAVTDPGWFQHLSGTPGPKDANFWRPSARAIRLMNGTPFLFKLKAPFNAVAGFGFFAGFTILPDWLAWETFDEANGVGSLSELRGRLANIQGKARIAADPGGRIGCCLIAEARFFPRDAWIQAPADWPVRTQSGATYDLDQGEGRRIWAECVQHVSGESPGLLLAAEPPPRYGLPVLHTPRLGQGIFRVKVLDAYGRACAVTNEHSLPVLEAAHIKPYSNGGEHHVSNGMTLRSDLHRLFDRGYVTIDEDYRFVVGSRLKEEFENGRYYYGIHGRQVALPREDSLRPTQFALSWHREHAFLG